MSTADEALKQIRDEVFALASSPLYAYRTENKYFPVLGEGAHDSEIVFVGEAPGEKEAKSGRPFCGPAGRILDELLAHIGMDRASVYVTNLVKDRPPGNRDPEPSEIALYGPFLDRQLAAIGPKVIVTLGRHSMKYVFERYGLAAELDVISKIHGKMFQGEAPHGPIKVVALYHPAVALYNGSMKGQMKEDAEILKQFIRRT